MPLVVVRRIGLAAVALAWGLAAAAAAPLPAGRADAANPAEKLRRDLDRVISLELDQQPLHLAVNQLHEQTKINFVLDRFTLGQMNVDPEQTTVTLRLKDVKLRSALRTLLTPYNLSFAIVGDTLLISSEDMAMFRQMRQRVNVDLEKVEFGRALKQMARETATNLVVDARVGKEALTPVSLQMEDVPLETAVRLMAEMVNLKPVRVGNALFVTSKVNAAEMRADPDLAPQPQPNNPGQPGVPVAAPPGAAVVVPAAPPAAPPATKPAEGEEDKSKPDKPKPDEEKAKPDKPAEKPAEKPAKPDKPEKPAEKTEKSEKP
jgi:hypothetical protein